MATAESVAKALGGRKIGNAWMARCPVHDDQEPSLAIVARGGKVLVRCHAGCDQHDVIAALRARGAWENTGWHASRSLRKPDCEPPAEPDLEAIRRTKTALAIWQSAATADGTLTQTYLQSRGLHVAPPKTLRFHPGLKHPSGGIWPAMVALVTNGESAVPIAVHRTFLARDGTGKAPIHPQKMALGPCRGGAVRLAAPGDVLMVGEGIETCMAAMYATGYPAWSALSTSGLRGLGLPKDVCDVIVLADGDEAGEKAARDCAQRWKREGRRVRIARPPWGTDFNDLLLANSIRIGGAL
jgi:putative DNA primase/helicase